MTTTLRSVLGTDRRLGLYRRWRVLAVVCVAVAAINIDVSIVNVTLPALVRELHASTSRLQWVVDAYQLSFAALVLAAGSLSDRFGRKGALMVGLVLFGSASGAGAAATTSGQLIAARVAMGVGAAIVFPNTLSIISNVFTERAERAKAIGVWGATAGMAIASGPVLGGWLLEHFFWGSAFLCMVPLAAIAIVLVALNVPTSRDPAAPRLDRAGLALSTAGLGVLVYTVIEAPVRGWSNPASIAGFAAAAVIGTAFVGWERRTDAPMLDVGLFTNLRFSAASGAVTVAYFALFGFTFMVTMYFQFLRGWSPFSYGIRLLPVAVSLGAASALGTVLAVRVGNKAVVAAGLTLMAAGFVWVSRYSLHTTYLEIAATMVVLPAGIGLTTAPATEAIMGVVPKEKAGVGSAVNDATRELGGTLGLAITGSVFSSLYIHRIIASHAVTTLGPRTVAAAKESVGSALIAARSLASTNPAGARALTAAAHNAFFHGYSIACIVSAVVAIVGAGFVATFLPARPAQPGYGGGELGDVSEPLLAIEPAIVTADAAN